MTRPSPSTVTERYGPSFATFAAPGDQQEDVWILRFSDPDCREAVFTGDKAENAAWEAWNRYAPSYNCFVFRLAHLRDEASGHTALLREIARKDAALREADLGLSSLGKALPKIGHFPNSVEAIEALLVDIRAALSRPTHE